MAPAVGERNLPPHSTWQRKQRTMANATAGNAMARADYGQYDGGRHDRKRRWWRSWYCGIIIVVMSNVKAMKMRGRRSFLCFVLPLPELNCHEENELTAIRHITCLIHSHMIRHGQPMHARTSTYVTHYKQLEMNIT